MALDPKHMALIAIFSELGLGTDIKSVDDRKLKQKAVYLSQVSGVDLGYRYGWYLMGPYCPALTRDYYAIDEIYDPEGHGKFELIQKYKPSIEQVCSVIINSTKKPDELKVTPWLELVASVHFLKNVSKHEEIKIVERIAKQKPTLAPYVDVGLEVAASI